MATTAAIAGIVSALGSVGSGIAGMGRSAAQQQQQAELSQQSLNQSRDNQIAQQIVQAMVNRRAVAGTQDPFGGGTQYDPATNTWISTLGALPKAADTAAFQAGITRDTTDLQQQELANREAMRRAAMNAPTADTAARELNQYRDMPASQLVGLLSGQATEAARQAYDPLRSDVLRSVARTGSAAGPVLSQLGLSEAQNLRNSLRDSLITGMTSVEDINQKRRGGLENAAVNANTLAAPQLGATGIQGSAMGQALQQMTGQRAANAALQTAYGAAGPNKASELTSAAYNKAIGQVPDPNFGLNQISTGLKEIGTAFNKGGAGRELLGTVGSWFGSGSGGSSNAVSPDYSNEAIFGSNWASGG